MPVIAYKNKEFHRWAKKENLSDALLLAALDEMERGLVEADLGGNVLKNAFLWGKERVVALEPYWLTRKMIEPFYIWVCKKYASQH
jgi:hypothetical protein